MTYHSNRITLFSDIDKGRLSDFVESVFFVLTDILIPKDLSFIPYYMVTLWVVDTMFIIVKPIIKFTVLIQHENRTIDWHLTFFKHRFDKNSKIIINTLDINVILIYLCTI